jgi:lysylphosphatidylglycerol synthetase-like protein (DUF2156 family)
MAELVVSESVEVERDQYVKLVRKWADVNTDGLLEESCQAFFTPEIEGFVGYRIENAHAVVFGDPVCSPEDSPLLTKAFHAFCAENKLGVIYTIISKEFADWAHQNLSASIIEFGEKFTLDPFHNPAKNTGPHAVLVRKKIKHALKDGVTVHEYKGDDPEIEKEIISVANAWVERRRGPQIYLAHVTLFNDRIGKRWFYGEQNGKIVGFLVLNEIAAKKGWLLNNLMMLQDAPSGLSELLIISVLENLEKEDCHYVLAGPVTLPDLGRVEGMHVAIEKLTRLAFKGAKMIFHLDGYETFWVKFDPQLEGSYLAFPNNNIGYSSVKALLRAFNLNIGS